MTATLAAVTVHTALTVEDVDTINACPDRILHNTILVRALLNEDAVAALDEFETLENLLPALHDVATRIMEDATLIHARMELAEARTKGGAR
jgi:hypothetical protein